MKKISFSLFSIFIFISAINAQDDNAPETITFPSLDSLTITADLYITNDTLPYIIFFHQAGCSRGEYKEIIPKISKLGYNGIAVDLRSGKEVNYIKNETAALAISKSLPTQYNDAEQDVRAAINYIYTKSGKQVVVLGSSYSASLCLIVAKSNPKVKAVLAFSPGEYLKPKYNVEEELRGFDKPIFVASMQREYTYIVTLLSNVLSPNKTIFKPNGGQGKHGAKALWNVNETKSEYWMALHMFLKKL